MFETRRGIFIALALLLSLTAAVYWPGLSGPLILDDVSNLEPLRVLQQQGRLEFAEIMRDRGGWLDRPVAMLSFYGNWLLTGDDVWSLKLTNLLIHLASGLLVFFLADCLLQRLEQIPQARVRVLALSISALWLLAPIQISTVLYIIQRMAQLSALFSLAGLLCFCLGRERLRRSAPGGHALILAAILMAWPLATLSKENGALLPLLLLLSEWFFFNEDSGQPGVRRMRAGLMACVVIPAVLVVAYALIHPEWIGKFYPLRSFTLEQRLLTQPRVLLDYAANVVQLPGFSPLGFFHDDVITSRSVFNPPATALSLALLIASGVLGLRWRNSDWRPVGYGILFFLCAHLVEAGVFPLEMYFEHRNYLPAFGLLLAVVCGVYLLGRRLEMPGLFIIALFAVAISYAGLSAARAWVWRSWEDIVWVAVARHPDSVRAQAGAAINHLLAGRIDEARPHLQRERELAGLGRETAVNIKLMAGYCLAGRTIPARVYSALGAGPVLTDNPADVSALRWFEDVVRRRGCGAGLHSGRVVDILERLGAALTGPGPYSHNWEVHYLLGRLLLGWQRPQAARAHFDQAYRFAPASRLQEIRSLLREVRA